MTRRKKGKWLTHQKMRRWLIGNSRSNDSRNTWDIGVRFRQVIHEQKPKRPLWTKTFDLNERGCFNQFKKQNQSPQRLIFDVIWTYIRSYCKWVPTWKWVHEKSYPGKCENSWDIKDPHPARVFNYYPWILMVIVENIGYKKYRSY